jgi:hypothetical protein
MVAVIILHNPVFINNHFQHLLWIKGIKIIVHGIY